MKSHLNENGRYTTNDYKHKIYYSHYRFSGFRTVGYLDLIYTPKDKGLYVNVEQLSNLMRYDFTDKVDCYGHGHIPGYLPLVVDGFYLKQLMQGVFTHDRKRLKVWNKYLATCCLFLDEAKYEEGELNEQV